MTISPLWISLQVAVYATIFATVFGVLAAYFVRKCKRFRTILDILFTLPMVLPPTVTGFFLLVILGKNSPVGTVLQQIGLPFIFTLRGAVAAAFVVSMPLVYRAMRGALLQLQPQWIFAARTLGASETKIFFRVILPNCKNGLLAGVVLCFARAMGEFGATIMIAGNIPNQTQTMALVVYTAVQSGNRSLAYTWAVVIVLLSACAMMMIQRLEKQEKDEELF